jgi:aflatoxin B1 aldehyde reductase
VSRKPETIAFPPLRRIGIEFYAYSPLCGGFLAKTPAQITGRGADAGRFNAQNGLQGEMYNIMYNKPTYLRVLELWVYAVEQAGCSKAELTIRWLAYDSALSTEYGDAIAIGASKAEQVSETLKWFKKGSVGPKVKARTEEIWKTVEHEAPLDNYDSFFRDNQERYFGSSAKPQAK